MIFKKYKLSELCTIKYGKDHKVHNDGEIPVYGTGGIMRHIDDYIYDQESVLIPRKGTLTGIFYVENKFWTVDTLFWTIINKNNVVPKYLYYYLLTIDFNNMNVGSAVPSLTTKLLNEIEIFLPNINEQSKILNILSSIDSKIELNNKINNNLEELAQALYKHWFVDFEFPNEEGLPYKSSGGKMVESELGLIPKGWEVKELGSACDIKYGKNFPTKNLLQNGFPVFGGNGVIGYSESFIYKEPQTLVACRGAASGKVQVSLPKSFVTNNSLVLLHNNTLKYAYLKEFSISRGYYDFVTGSAQPQITIASISKCKILVPKYSVQQVFSDTLQETYDMILNLDRQGETLAKTRDLLLPKLMSGELRVPIEE